MFHPFTGHEGPQGEYSSTLFQISALEGGEGSASRTGRTLPPGKTRYPLYRRLGGPVWTGAENLAQPGFDPRTFQPVGSRYIDYATRSTLFIKTINLLKPNDIYICRTAALTSRRYILNIYSTNIHTEYFKHAA